MKEVFCKHGYKLFDHDCDRFDEKMKLTELLFNDFVKEFPNSERNERVHLSGTLKLMELEDLRLMASQLKKG